jgi:hypothetical protein
MGGRGSCVWWWAAGPSGRGSCARSRSAVRDGKGSRALPAGWGGRVRLSAAGRLAEAAAEGYLGYYRYLFCNRYRAFEKNYVQ